MLREDNLPARFIKKYRKDPKHGCWVWTASNVQDYGKFWWQFSTVQAHRFAYEWLVGPIPEGLHLMHWAYDEGKCVGPRCVNPRHLRPGTPQENNDRSTGPSAKNKDKTHCKHGHPFDEENTYWYPGRNGTSYRGCKTCKALSARKYKNLKAEGPIQTPNKDKTHCPAGHPYDEANTGWQNKNNPNRKPSRYCRTCARIQVRNRERKLKQQRE